MAMTLDGTTGIVLPSAAAPAFSAYGSTNQNISSSTYTKVVINVKTFDTNSNFDTSNYRFTPTVAGYYQINAIVEAYGGGSPVTGTNLLLYKNGSEILRSSSTTNSTNTEVYNNLSGLIYMNGSTDYLELYAYVTSVGTIYLYGSNTYKTFSGFLARSA